jgi:hypothetical protein
VTSFLHNYIYHSSEDPLPSRGHVDYLEPRYAHTAAGPALALAVDVMAGRAINLFHGQSNQVSTFLAGLELDACRALKLAVSDPVGSLQDETLLAVLCLDFATHLQSRGAELGKSHPHLDGAVALIRHRGPNSFGTLQSHSLLAATRGIALANVMWFLSGRSEGAVKALVDFPKSIGQGCPAKMLRYLLAKVLTVEDEVVAARGLEEESEGSGREQWSRVCQLEDELMRLFGRLPERWRDYTQTSAPVAYFPAQYHCTRLCLLGLKAMLSCSDSDFIDAISEGIRILLQTLHRLLQRLQSISNMTDTPPKSMANRENLTQQKTGIVVPASLGVYPAYRGEAPSGRYYIYNLVRWILREISAIRDRTPEVAIPRDAVEQLEKWYERSVVEIEGSNPAGMLDQPVLWEGDRRFAGSRGWKV